LHLTRTTNGWAGGTLLRRAANSATVGWLLVTAIHTGTGWSEEQVSVREREIHAVRE